MLKFSGYPYLIRGQTWSGCLLDARLASPCYAMCCARSRGAAANAFGVSPREGQGQAPNTKPGEVQRTRRDNTQEA